MKLFNNLLTCTFAPINVQYQIRKIEFIQKYTEVDKNNISTDSLNEVEVRGLTLSNEVLIDNSFLDQSLSGYDILRNVTRSKEDTKKDAFCQLDIDDLENNVVDAKIT